MIAPRVLVGIVSRNRAAILPKAVNSALAQTAPNLRVVVLDDASTDDTPKLPEQFPQVNWIRRGSSLGYMSARNELMGQEGADFFVSLDDDAWFLHGDEIAVALKYLDENPSVAAVAFDVLAPDHPETRERGAAEVAAVFIGCGHMLRLSAIRKVGCYEPTPGRYGGEEKDLCLRLMDAGFSIARLPGVHVWHDKTPVAREILDQHRSGVCNDLVMTIRRTPLLLLPAAMVAKLFRHLAFSRRAGLLRSCLSGFALCAKSVPGVLRARRPVSIETIRSYVALSRK